MTRKSDDQYSDEEGQRRFEAALRGEREVGAHEELAQEATEHKKEGQI